MSPKDIGKKPEEDAVLKYEQADPLEDKIRLKALDRFLSTRFNISWEDWRMIMEEDVYRQ